MEHGELVVAVFGEPDLRVVELELEAIRRCRRVAATFVPLGAAVAEELDEGVVVAILADAGWKYLSADFWDADDVEQAMERIVWW